MKTLQFLNFAGKDQKETISESEVNKWEFFYQMDLQFTHCCEKKITDGCYFRLEKSRYYKFCNSCLINFYDELAKITSSKAKVKFFTLSLGVFKYTISRNSVFILFRKLETYFLKLYRLHVRDDFFIHNDNLKKLVTQNNKKLNITEKEKRIAAKLSQAEKRSFFLFKQLKEDQSFCYGFPFEIIKSKHEDSEIYTYSLVNYSLSCSFDKRHKAVMVITDNEMRGFTFALCLNDLNQFGKLLWKTFFNEIENNLKIGCFYVQERRTEKPCCFFTNKKAQYKLMLNQCTLWLCRAAMEKLAISVFTSAVYKEFFPIQAQQFLTLSLKLNGINGEIFRAYHSEFSKQKREISELKRTVKSKNLKFHSTLQYYNNYIENKNSQLSRLNESEKKLLIDKQNLEFKLSEIEKQKQAQVLALQKRIINCLSYDHTYNLGISQKKAEQYKVGKLKTTFIKGISSLTLDPYDRSNFTVVIETGRGDKDNFCFALNLKDINLIIDGIQNIKKASDTYFNNEVNFSIVPNHISTEHCYFCGSLESPKYSITLNQVRFTLCWSCLQNFLFQLTEIKKEFTEKRKIAFKQKGATLLIS